MSTSPTASTPPTPPAKRPYVAPALVVHGDVQTLTQAGIVRAIEAASELSAP